MTCPLCGYHDGAPVHGPYEACGRCGLVHAPAKLHQDVPTLRPPDGWHQRASHLGPEIPKAALACPSVAEIAAALELGPVYIETPNANEPALSLAHFFRDGRDRYYSPETLAIAIALAGAADVAMDEVAGHVTALVIPGGARRSYAEAVAELGIPVPDGAAVALRLRNYFDARPSEVLGDEVAGPCFLCGGVRRAWRSVAICVECSALTTQTQPPDPLDGLEVSATTPTEFLVPDMRATSPDVCEQFTSTHGVFLDEAGWGASLLRAGADLVRIQKHQGALQVAAVALGEPRKKTFAEAREILKTPFREARLTAAVWGIGPPKATRLEAWLAGGDEDPVYLRAEMNHARRIAGMAIDALSTLASACEAQQDDPDDWHAEPYQAGMRMGAAGATLRCQSMATSAYIALLEATIRD